MKALLLQRTKLVHRRVGTFAEAPFLKERIDFSRRSVTSFSTCGSVSGKSPLTIFDAAGMIPPLVPGFLALLAALRPISTRKPEGREGLTLTVALKVALVREFATLL